MLYPVLLDVEAADVLVVGGGRVAVRKVLGLVECGAEVTVVAPFVRPELHELATTVHARPFEPDDVVGRRLVLTATGDAVVDQSVFTAAAAHGIWVNSADDPPRCSFILPAVLRRGPVVVSVSSSGTSPALAVHLRDTIADALPSGIEGAAATLAARREAIRGAGGSTEDVDWADEIARVLEP